MELKGKTLNFLGDSITYGGGPFRFTDVIAQEQGAKCNNYGICGTRIAKQIAPSWSAEMDRHYLTRVDEMEAPADAVLVFGGTNDFGHGDAPLGSITDRTEDTFYGALHLLAQALMTRYPTAIIAFLTPLHRLDEPLPGEPTDRRATLSEYVQAIHEVAGWYGLPVLDLYISSGMQPQVEANRQAYMPDGLHPNEAGHRLLADQIVAFLKQR